MKRKEFAIIGLGRFGSNVALTLEAHGHHVLAIDVDPNLVQEMAPHFTQAAVADATSEAALKSLDIASFPTVVVAIGTDFESNLMATVSCKNLGVKHVICKAQTERQAQILLRVGADQVIRPEHEAGVRLAESIIAPTMLEHFALGKDTDYSIAEFRVPSPIACMSLAQSDLRGRYGLTILVIKRGDEVIVNPPPDAILQPQDVVVILGHDRDIERFAQV